MLNNNYLQSSSNNYDGSYRAMLLYDGIEARIFIPGMYCSQIKESDLERMKKCFPIAIFASVQMRETALIGQSPCYVVFENGDLQRPIVTGYFGKGIRSIGGSVNSGGLSSTGNNDNTITNNDGFITNVTYIDNLTFYNSLIRCINGTDAGYIGDEGLDVSAPIGTPVYSPCDGNIRYSEFGHTPWGRTKWGKQHNDTCYSIGIDMNKSVSYGGKQISYVFLTHLSKLVYNIPSGSGGKNVKAGELIAYSGIANDSPHLHIGLSPSNWSPLTMQQTRDFFKSKSGEKWEVGK